MADTSAPDSGYTPTNLPQDGPTSFIDAADVTTDIQGLTDRFNAHIHTVTTGVSDNEVTTAKILDANVTSRKISLTYGQFKENTGALSGGSWTNIGTGFSVTTPVANCVVWVSFAGRLINIHTAANSTSRVSIGVGGSGQEGTWYAENKAATGADSATVTIPLGFTVPVVVASAGLTPITLRGILVVGVSYEVEGVLSAYVVGP